MKRPKPIGGTWRITLTNGEEELSFDWDESWFHKATHSRIGFEIATAADDIRGRHVRKRKDEV